MGENETRFLSLSGQGFQLIRGTVMAEKKEFIRIRGARENNLKALNVDIPRNQFVVFTGLSGSGKSSLAFDTIYAEGQRRYMESLSSYARQFLGQMEKPNVDSIEGLPPAISIDQKSTNRNPRSTVGTVTEIYDYFRLLYARIAEKSSAASRWTRWSIRSWHSRSGRKSSFSRRLCAAAREDTKRCSNRQNAAAMSA